MEQDFWHNAWENGKTGWRQRRVNTRLIKFWPDLLSDKPGLGRLADPTDSGSVLVPLCGDSPDLLWLSEQGHQVIGCEISELAVSAFYKDNNIEFVVSQDNGFQVYEGSGIRIYCGDFFALTADHLKEVSLVYDRAATVALPSELRTAYSRHMTGLLPPGARILLLTFVYDQSRMDGPPFSIPDEEVHRLYGSAFSINKVGSHSGPEILGNLAERGLDTVQENIYHLGRGTG